MSWASCSLDQAAPAGEEIFPPWFTKRRIALGRRSAPCKAGAAALDLMQEGRERVRPWKHGVRNRSATEKAALQACFRGHVHRARPDAKGPK